MLASKPHKSRERRGTVKRIGLTTARAGTGNRCARSVLRARIPAAFRHVLREAPAVRCDEWGSEALRWSERVGRV